MLGNLGNMMRQVQEMQAKAEKIREELAEKRLTATSGGELVTVTVDGTGRVVDLAIDGGKIGLDDDDTEILQDAVLAAIRDAAEQAEEEGAEMMEQLTGGLKLPPGLGF